MVKLTKAQMKDRDRIEAWINGEPFKENSRDRNPKVPELSVDEVLETYVPQYISDGAKFYTPLEMGERVWNRLTHRIEPGTRILDPCAGIGNLIYWPYEYTADGQARLYQELDEDFRPVQIVAVELDQEAYRVGSKLFPDAEWHNASAYEIVPEWFGTFDIVLMNPPFNITWATGSGAEMSEGLCKKSEHMFLYLAMQALKEDGVAHIIAPYNYIDRLPKAMKEWFNKRHDSWNDFGELPGQFRFTGVSVHHFMVRRNGYDVQTPKLDYIETDQALDYAEQTASLQGAPDNLLEDVQDALPEPGHTEPQPPVPVVSVSTHIETYEQVPASVYETLNRVLIDQTELPPSVKQAITLAQRIDRSTAAWLKSNGIAYGMGYYNGFTDGERTIPPQA